MSLNSKLSVQNKEEVKDGLKGEEYTPKGDINLDEIEKYSINREILFKELESLQNFFFD